MGGKLVVRNWFWAGSVRTRLGWVSKDQIRLGLIFRTRIDFYFIFFLFRNQVRIRIPDNFLGVELELRQF